METITPKETEIPISVKEFTQSFGSRSFLYSLIDKGVLKPHYLGRKPFFYVSEINKAMKQGTDKI
ncbi:MAG: hypothetical protein K2X86_18405 [Cytophagaceae bacterium]|nr:hypothetical protein [Cytophagaceae bacterium]